MRLNKFVALALDISRRKADQLISDGKISINNQTAAFNYEPKPTDKIEYNNQLLKVAAGPQIILMLNKPTGIVCSREGQGSNTIYDIIPRKYHSLNPIGRLDKDSSGLLIMTNDGHLHQELSHPSKLKNKTYQIVINKLLSDADRKSINRGIKLDDGISRLQLEPWNGSNGRRWIVTMHEGRNRQIRRTFAHLGYKVTQLNRIQFGPYELGQLDAGHFKLVK